MAFLQRSPLCVSADVPGEQYEQTVFDTTTRLLAASQGLRPYIGAYISLAMDAEEQAAMFTENGDVNETALGVARFLRPVNAAMQAWWSKNPLNPNLEPVDLSYSEYINGLESGTMHMDQGLHALDSHVPIHGPLTALLTFEGETGYKLGVDRTRVFDERNFKFFTFDEAKYEGRTSEITIGTGGLLLFTNIPPTFHEAVKWWDRKTALYFSRFRERASAQ